MAIILGIDIGSTTTKIVGLHEDHTIHSTMRVRAEDSVTSLYGALGNYLTSNALGLSDIKHIALTGVGSTKVQGDIFNIPTCTIDEFHACAKGGVELSQVEDAVVVSMGTGTAFLYADKAGQVSHLCGSGVGGGTLAGLSRALFGTGQFEKISQVAQGGELRHINLTIQDLDTLMPDSLRPDMTASNFGHLAEDATHGDYAAGVINLVLETIGTMTVLACQGKNCNTVVLTGSMTMLPQITPTFSFFEELYGIRYLVPQHAAFATVIGAALCSCQEMNKA